MRWNLYLDAPASAAWNMAKDAWSLERARRTGIPSLRLYGWNRFVLSVGRAQQVEREIDLAACVREGVPLVRRSTGGRAVLHGSDLTYAVAAPTTLAGFGGGIMPIYRALSGVFVRFLQDLGCEPEVKAYAGRERAAQASAICFATPSAFEILVEGRKLIGSAQRLLPTAFLQHGSMPLEPQQALLARLFRGADEAQVRSQMTDLRSIGILEHRDVPTIRQRLVDAFAAELGAEFEQPDWGDEDDAAVQALTADYPALSAREPSGKDDAAGRQRRSALPV